MSKQSHKSLIEKTAKESTMLQDFAAGIDPTGVRTFRNALDNEKSHGKHKLMGDVGGFVGGAAAGALMPAALTGVASLALRKKLPGLSKDLGYMAKGSLDAFNPKKVRSYIKAMPGLSKFQTAGSDLMRKSNSLMDDMKKGKSYVDGLRSTPRSYPDIENLINTKNVGAMKDRLKDFGDANDKVQAIGKDLSQNYFNGASVSEGAQRSMTALTTLGTALAGGALNASSAHMQYNTARNTKKLLNEE